MQSDSRVFTLVSTRIFFTVTFNANGGNRKATSRALIAADWQDLADSGQTSQRPNQPYAAGFVQLVRERVPQRW